MLSFILDKVVISSKLYNFFFLNGNIFKSFSNSLDYNIILINFIIITIIASILIVINYFIRQKNNNWEMDPQKYAAYECGFEPFSETQSHIFEIQFFLVSIMFLIFDIELALMFPWAVYFNFLNKFAFWVMIFFIILLTIGFFYEWKKGALNWNNANTLKSSTPVIWLCWFYNSDFFMHNLNFSWIIEYFFAIFLLSTLVLIILINSVKTSEIVSKKIQQITIFIWSIMLMYYIKTSIISSSSFTLNFYITNYFIIDSYTQACKIFIIFSLLIIFYFCISDYMYYHKYIIWELPIILLLASFFMILLISSFNLFSLFVSLEGLSLCLYILSVYDFDRRSSTEAAIKYFTLGTLSSGFLLLGIVFIYIAVGSLDYLTIYQCTYTNAPQPLVRVGSGLIFFSFLFKLGIWPCHQWVADVYTGIPMIITAIFSTSVKATIFFTLVRLYNYIIIEKPIMAIISIMSLLVSIFGALQTAKLKRFLAYAAINQMGFILLGLFTYSIDVVLIYFIFYILTTLMIFLILLKTISINTIKAQEMIYISDLKILSFYNPSMRFYLLIILFSMAGLPPFITALTKWYILIVLLNKYYVLLCSVSIILTIFSIYYYVRLIKHIFFENFTLPVCNDKPVFYFKGTRSVNLFLNLSSLILSIGSIIIYINIYKFLDIFTVLGNFCNLTTTTMTLIFFGSARNSSFYFKRHFSYINKPEQTNRSLFRQFIDFRRTTETRHFLIISFIFFFSMRLFFGYITWIQWILFCSVCILLYLFTYTKIYIKFKITLGDANASFDEYLQTKHWIWRTEAISSPLVRILIFTYCILSGVGYNMHQLPTFMLIFGIVLLYHGIISLGLFYFAFKKKNPWKIAQHALKCTTLACGGASSMIGADMLIEKSLFGMNHRTMAQNLISYTGRWGLYSDSDMHFSLYNEYIHDNPRIQDKSQFYDIGPLHGKKLNKSAIESYIIREHGTDTLDAIKQFSTTGQLRKIK